VSFTVDGGNTLALVGPTGAGKSTVMKLLMRMYDVDEGAVRVDGQDLRDVTLPSLRQAIGYVSQETFLFYGTVKENITYGTFGATDEEIVEAAKAAEAHAFIQNLPEGYDTKVGERGVKLSGGQRQRIAIARAVLKDPDILVLDEATSDVDTETEMLIQRSLDTLTADRTTFAIAHRLSTIKDADQIVVLEDGQVVESRSHAELLEENGLYANLWAVQAGRIDELPRSSSSGPRSGGPRPTPPTTTTDQSSLPTRPGRLDAATSNRAPPSSLSVTAISPAVGVDDLGDDGQAEPGPVLDGRVAELEDLLAVRGRDPGPVVCHEETGTVVESADADRQLSPCSSELRKRFSNAAGGGPGRRGRSASLSTTRSAPSD